MKTNKLKKAILAVTLAASMVIPTALTTTSAVMTVNAASNMPFCVYNAATKAYNFQENQIYISRGYFDEERHTVSTYLSHQNLSGTRIFNDGYYITSYGDIDLQPLAKYVLVFDISGKDLKRSDVEKMQLSTYFKTKDKTSYSSVQPSVEDINYLGDNTYRVPYELVSYGDTFYFQTTSVIKDLTINVTNASLYATAENEEYYKIEARPSDGEKLYIRIKNDPSISWGKMEAWARRLCLYVNSLSRTTGINLDTLYMNYDYISNDYAFSANSIVNHDQEKYGYVAFCPHAADAEREQISTGRNVITWTTLHEVAHSYDMEAKQSKFYEYYNFRQAKEGFKADFDEYLTNARGLTAIQNCDNLHNTDVHYRHCYDPKNNYYIDYYGKYNEIAQTVAYVYPNNYFEYAKNLTINFTWEELEEFFAAESDNDPDFVASREVAKWLNDKLDMNIPYTENYLKFANNFRKLAVIKYGNYDEASLNNVRARIGRNLIKAVIKDLKLDEF